MKVLHKYFSIVSESSKRLLLRVIYLIELCVNVVRLYSFSKAKNTAAITYARSLSEYSVAKLGYLKSKILGYSLFKYLLLSNAKKIANASVKQGVLPQSEAFLWYRNLAAKI